MKKVALALLLVLSVSCASRACSPDCAPVESVTLVTPFVATVKVRPVVVVQPVVVQKVVTRSVVVRQRVVTPALVRRVVVHGR